MNDSFYGQNSVAFYQPPATQPASTDPVMPVTQATNEPAPLGGQSAAFNSTGDQSTAPVMQNMSPMGGMPASTPASVSNSAPVSASATSSDADDIVQKLAARIEAYKAAEPAPQSNVSFSSPLQAVHVAPAASTTDTSAMTYGEETVPAAITPSVAPSMSTPASVATWASTPAPTPASAPAVPAAPVSSTQAPSSEPAEPSAESLDAQNIFELLGVMDGSEAEKEAFLDELQQVIWEDFLENDAQLLLTKAEMTELQGMLAQVGKSDSERQEMAVGFLEKLIPDLESIMLEKALELKREMVFERAAGLRELHSGKAEMLTKITEAELAFKQDKWHSGARILNTLA